VDNGGAYVTSGAGAMVPTKDQSNTPRMQAKLNGQNWPPSPSSTSSEPTSSKMDVDKQQKQEQETIVGGLEGHSYQTVFNDKVL
jgi:hypothetical protein